eukprot:3564238-Pleurochrysis_carterae.AAC.2
MGAYDGTTNYINAEHFVGSERRRERRALNVEIATAGVVERCVVNREGHVQVPEERMRRGHAVAWLDDGGGRQGRRVDDRAKARARAATGAVEAEGALSSISLLTERGVGTSANVRRSEPTTGGLTMQLGRCAERGPTRRVCVASVSAESGAEADALRDVGGAA